MFLKSKISNPKARKELKIITCSRYVENINKVTVNANKKSVQVAKTVSVSTPK